MKPYVEHVSNQENFTWRVGDYTGGYGDFEWHYHSVYELVFHLNHKGQLIAGAYSEPLPEASLALFGPRLPHTNILEPRFASKPSLTRVVWFNPTWIDTMVGSLAEYQPLRTLLHNSQKGLLFSPGLANRLKVRLDDFNNLSPMRQSARILEVLVELAEDSSAHVMNPGMQLHANAFPEASDDKTERIIRYIEQHYHEPIDLTDLADHLHISRSSVQRTFKRQFLQSFSDHLAEYRIGKACELLVNTEQPISVLSQSVGYTNLSNFNRQFKKIKKTTPKTFRNSFRV